MKGYFACLAVVMMNLSGCTYLSIQNTSGDADATTFQSGQWHHALLYERVTLSDPIDPSVACRGHDWHSIRTTHSFAAVPLSAALYPVFGPSVLGMGLWTPSWVSIECRDRPQGGDQ